MTDKIEISKEMIYHIGNASVSLHYGPHGGLAKVTVKNPLDLEFVEFKGAEILDLKTVLKTVIDKL